MELIQESNLADDSLTQRDGSPAAFVFKDAGMVVADGRRVDGAQALLIVGQRRVLV